MLYGLYLSTSGVKAQSWRNQVIANNVANANTDGFRQQLAVIRARDAHAQEFGAPDAVYPDDPTRIGGGVHMYEAPTDIESKGPLKRTNRQTDFAIRGDGFFQVRRGGVTFLTRDGSFSLNDDGTFVTSDGSGELLTSGGSPLQVDANQPFEVDSTGQVFQNGIGLGQIAVVSPTIPDAIAREGNGLLRYDGPTQDAEASIEQGSLEGSNVEPILQMQELIESSRVLEMNVNMIQLQNDTLATLIQTVPRQT